jgi:uncharacterized phage protein (TIGR01671 family)
MSKLKFRVWDVLCKKFITSYDLDRNFGLDYNGELRCLMSSRLDHKFEIQRSTGIKDVNGVEIFEGDVIELVEDCLESTLGGVPKGDICHHTPD